MACPIIINPSSLPNGNVGTFYNQIIVASLTDPQPAPPCDNPTFTYSVLGTLPPGLTLNPTTGAITGTPTTTVGSPFNFAIQATQNFISVGCMICPPMSKEYTIIIENSRKKRRRGLTGFNPTVDVAVPLGTIPPQLISYNGFTYGNPVLMATNLNSSRSNIYRVAPSVPPTPLEATNLNSSRSNIYRYTIVPPPQPPSFPPPRTGWAI